MESENQKTPLTPPEISQTTQEPAPFAAGETQSTVSKKDHKFPKAAVYILALIFLITLSVFGFWFYQARLTERQSSTSLPIATPTSKFQDQREIIVSPSPTPLQKNYEEGVVLVTFNDGVTYKEAKDLFSAMNVQIENTNSYWKATNFIPDDSTILKKTDVFKIEVEVGKENEIINQLTQKSIIRAASKNFIGRITD